MCIDLRTLLEPCINPGVEYGICCKYRTRCPHGPNVSQTCAQVYLVRYVCASKFSPTTPFLKIFTGPTLDHPPACYSSCAYPTTSPTPSRRNYNDVARSHGTCLMHSSCRERTRIQIYSLSFIMQQIYSLTSENNSNCLPNSKRKRNVLTGHW